MIGRSKKAAWSDVARRADHGRTLIEALAIDEVLLELFGGQLLLEASRDR